MPSSALGHGAGRAQQQVRIKARSPQLGSAHRQPQTLSCYCTRLERLLAKCRNTDQFIQTFATTIARRRKCPHFRDGETKAQGQALQRRAEDPLRDARLAASTAHAADGITLLRPQRGRCPAGCPFPRAICLHPGFLHPRERLVYETKWAGKDAQALMVVDAAMRRLPQ